MLNEEVPTVETEVVAPGRIEKKGLKSLSMQEVAAEIYREAIDQARLKLDVKARNEALPVLLRRPDFLETFSYALACGVAKILAASDQNIKAIYTYDTTQNPDCELEEETSVKRSVDLIVHCERASTGLKKRVESLDEALTVEQRALPLESFRHLASVLNCCFVTDEDIRSGEGSAILLGSAFTRPTRIWVREV